jgi:hypothetical protein
MLDALVSGTTDPKVLAELARGVLRKELPALREALEGRLDAEHALVVGEILAHIGFRRAVEVLRFRESHIPTCLAAAHLGRSAQRRSLDLGQVAQLSSEGRRAMKARSVGA